MSASEKNKNASSIWGGRFDGGVSAVMERINASIGFDREMYRQDIAGSRAHTAMLVDAGIITAEDGAAISNGLTQIEAEIEAGTFTFSPALEDIHMNIENRLVELVGEPGRRLHTARSRNDQVATDLRLWVRDAIDGIDRAVSDLQSALLDQAETHAATVMPGYTHLQTAQPVTVGHHLMAYAEMLMRDRGRFADARQRMNESPLGAAALAGTSFPVDRHATAAALALTGRCVIRWTRFPIVILPWNSLPRHRFVPHICHALPKNWCSGRLIDLALSDSPMPFPRARQSCRRSVIPMRLSLSAPSRDG